MAFADGLPGLVPMGGAAERGAVAVLAEAGGAEAVRAVLAGGGVTGRACAVLAETGAAEASGAA